MNLVLKRLGDTFAKKKKIFWQLVVLSIVMISEGIIMKNGAAHSQSMNHTPVFYRGPVSHNELFTHTNDFPTFRRRLQHNLF